MALPQKEYFDFEDLAARWNIPVRDVLYYAKNDYFQTLVWIDSKDMAAVDETCPIAEIYKFMSSSGLKGYVVVSPDDIHRIVLSGSVKVRCFKSADKSLICFVPFSNDPLEIRGEHLRVHIRERARFEEAYEIRPVQKTAAPLISFPGRASIMHKIINKFDERCQLGVIEGKLIEECRELRKWIVTTHPDDQPPTENTIANALRSSYRKAKTIIEAEKLSGQRSKLSIFPLWFMGTHMGLLSDLFDLACDCVV